MRVRELTQQLFQMTANSEKTISVEQTKILSRDNVHTIFVDVDDNTNNSENHLEINKSSMITEK